MWLRLLGLGGIAVLGFSCWFVAKLICGYACLDLFAVLYCGLFVVGLMLVP